VSAPQWMHAGAHQAEAGFKDPALGWVGVRADLSGGAVHAAVIPNSADAAQVLSAHLSGLSEYLREEQTHVATLNLAWSGGAESGTGQSMQQGSGENGERQRATGSQPNMQAGEELIAGSLTGSKGAEGDGAAAPNLSEDIPGAHISVMA